MKIAILISGEYREFSLAHKFWTFLKWPNTDIYFATWDKSIFYPQDPNLPPIVETITTESITDYLTVKNMEIAPAPDDIHGYTSKKMINRWQSSIRMMIDSGIEYDIVILIRPDIALSYDDETLKKFIFSISSNNTFYGIISYPLNKMFPLTTIKKVSDLILVGTPDTMIKLLNLSMPVHIDIHKYLADNFIEMGISLMNLPIPKQCIVRSNCRGQSLNFEECKLKAKEWWERRKKVFYDLADNIFDSQPNESNSTLPYQVYNCINLWDKFDYNIWVERNQINQWDNYDSEEKYNQNSKDPKLKYLKTYSKTDIYYNYNSLGFRVSHTGPKEFEDAKIYPKVLVGGCSVTEGIGLPEEHIWHSFLVEKLKRHSNLPIAKFNVGKGGRSISAAIRYAYIAIEHYNFKPDVVFLCLPPVTRAEILIKSPNTSYPSTHHYIPELNAPRHGCDEIKEVYKNYLKVVNYRQFYHECFKTLLLFKWLCEAKNITWYFNFWNDNFASHVIQSNLKDDLVDCSIPKELEKHFVPGRMISPFTGTFEQNIARDYSHYGPNAHYEMAEQLYKYILNTENFTTFTSKWKKK